MLEFDFTQLQDENFKKNFKEDSVREFIIAPLLKKLDFKPKVTNQKLEMQLSLREITSLQVGSNKSLETEFNPDYTTFADSKPP